MFVEITKEAAKALISQEDKPVKVDRTQVSYTSDFVVHGVRVRYVNNFVSCVEQYFIQDINA